MNTFTEAQSNWISAVLANGKDSTDAELIEYFAINGLNTEQASYCVARRDRFLKHPRTVSPFRITRLISQQAGAMGSRDTIK